jgi:hypothetical protein
MLNDDEKFCSRCGVSKEEEGPDEDDEDEETSPLVVLSNLGLVFGAMVGIGLTLVLGLKL